MSAIPFNAAQVESLRQHRRQAERLLADRIWLAHDSRRRPVLESEIRDLDARLAKVPAQLFGEAVPA